MTIKQLTRISFVVMTVLLGSTGQAATHSLSVGPEAGGGTSSNGDKVLGARGLFLQSTHLFALPQSLSIGPVFEISNHLINTRPQQSQGLLNLYDHRLFGLGLGAQHRLPPPSSTSLPPLALYSHLLGGQAFSKLQQDRSTSDTFTESSYTDLAGTFYQIELGLRTLPVNNKLSFAMAIQSQSMFMNQEVSPPSSTRNDFAPGPGLRLTNDAEPETPLDRNLIQRIVSLKISAALAL